MTDQPSPRRPTQDNHRLDLTPPPPVVDAEPAREVRYPRVLHDFVMAMRFFSRLGMGDAPHETPNLDRMAPMVPFASLTIALLPALLMALLAWATTPPFVAATIGVGLLIVLTGAMPEDALADSADGLFGGTTIDRRLEIMKDSRHGTYGVVAIVLFVVLRIAAFGSIAATSPLAAAGVMLASSLIARSASLWLSVDLPSAREGGASASAGRPTRRSFALGVVFAAVLAVIVAGPFVGVAGLVVAGVAAVAVAVGWTTLCRRLIGGQTGDLIGAAQALIEIAALAVFAIFA